MVEYPSLHQCQFSTTNDPSIPPQPPPCPLHPASVTGLSLLLPLSFWVLWFAVEVLSDLASFFYSAHLPERLAPGCFDYISEWWYSLPPAVPASRGSGHTWDVTHAGAKDWQGQCEKHLDWKFSRYRPMGIKLEVQVGWEKMERKSVGLTVLLGLSVASSPAKFCDGKTLSTAPERKREVGLGAARQRLSQGRSSSTSGGSSCSHRRACGSWAWADTARHGVPGRR